MAGDAVADADRLDARNLRQPMHDRVPLRVRQAGVRQRADHEQVLAVVTHVGGAEMSGLRNQHHRADHEGDRDRELRTPTSASRMRVPARPPPGDRADASTAAAGKRDSTIAG